MLILALILDSCGIECKWKASSERIKEATTSVIQFAGEEDLRESTGNRDIGWRRGNTRISRI